MMSHDIIVAVIFSLPATITAVGGLIAVLIKVNNIHRDINSRMDQLLVSEKAISREEGMQQGRDNHL